jgi:hypothetical protein
MKYLHRTRAWRKKGFPGASVLRVVGEEQGFQEGVCGTLSTKRHAASTFEGGGQNEEQIEEQMREQNTQNSVKTVLLGTQ